VNGVEDRNHAEMIFYSIVLLRAVRSAITATAELLVCYDVYFRSGRTQCGSSYPATTRIRVYQAMCVSYRIQHRAMWKTLVSSHYWDIPAVCVAAATQQGAIWSLPQQRTAVCVSGTR